jgi:tetratricopeptide (TPR) repeat protein
MRMMVALLAMTQAAWGQEICPAVPDHAAERAQIMTVMRHARDQTEAQFMTNQLWQIWTDAPNARAQALLDEGMARRMAYDFAGSRAVLDNLIAYCPDYAEGWNQRAFAAFLAEDYAAALSDLDVALGIMPDHVAALSGKALTLIGLGRNDEAQEVLRAAVALNPWLGERALLIEPPGQDI